jgi:hypothetical protein
MKSSDVIASILIILDYIDGVMRSYSWFRHYATNRQVTGPVPDEVIGFFSIYLILPVALWL